jgi:hypothetical protein
MSSFASNTLTTIIASGQSLSAPILLDQTALVAVIAGSMNVTFQGSVDGAAYYNIGDDSGTEYAISCMNGYMHTVNLNHFLAPLWIKVRNGTADVPVIVGTATTLYLVSKEL